MKKLLLLLTFVIILGSSSAQNFVRKYNPSPNSVPVILNDSDTLKIFAVVVEFQEDSDPNTYGTGKLGTVYSKDYGNTILDPLPHNRQYFEDHLEFAQNYYRKVSNGKVQIEYFVYPQVITLSEAMREYSPPETSETFDELGSMCEEVWGLTDNFTDINLADYDLFTIFHAGVGRGLREGISLGNNRDLPSIYFSLKALKKIFGEQFPGFETSSGFKIQNTMIIPETNSRETNSFGTVYLTELSTNGLIVGSIGSYLGLPDLFNTETGLSAIGRFGLMDGQALFGFRGIFPPEPSPWEKIYLGWAEPEILSVGDHRVTITAQSAASIGDTTILKIPINANEYYLVEKRARDANKDGAKITYKVNGETRTKTFLKDQEGFIYYDVSEIDGVVVDVDEFDWAVPGIDSKFKFENDFEDVGLLIWHIDESVISEKILDNKINTDKTRRGVDVEEADGVQDIGEEFNTIFGTTEIGEGTKEDMWYSGNPAKLYKNVFDSDSYPDTKSNSGAFSLITMNNFSGIGNKMSFDVSFGESGIRLITETQIPVVNPVEYLNTLPSDDILLSSDSNLIITDLLGNVKDKLIGFSEFRPASGHLNSSGRDIIAGAFENKVNVYFPALSEMKSLQSDLYFSCAPVLEEIAGQNSNIYLGTQNGKILNLQIGEEITLLNSFDCFENKPVEQVCGSGQYFCAVSGNQFWDSNNKFLSVPSNIIQTAVFEYSLNYAAVVLTDDNTFYLIYDGAVEKTISPMTDSDIKGFVLSDLKNDGDNYIVFADRNKISALNLSGGMADNFPFADENENLFSHSILSADFDEDDYYDLLVTNNKGEIFLISGRDGKLFESYPISSGSGVSAYPALFNTDGRTYFTLASEMNHLFVWELKSDPLANGWTAENVNSNNNALAVKAGSKNQISDFFPDNRVYNWPNPVYGGETYIRYYVSEDSKINIKIFDLAGDLVADLMDIAGGGFDNETLWNVSDVQSGVYFARVEAVGSSGKTQSKIIKIAVIK